MNTENRKNIIIILAIIVVPFILSMSVYYMTDTYNSTQKEVVNNYLDSNTKVLFEADYILSLEYKWNYDYTNNHNARLVSKLADYKKQKNKILLIQYSYLDDKGNLITNKLRMKYDNVINKYKLTITTYVNSKFGYISNTWVD